MGYQEEYRRKLTTPEEAVKAVRSGDWLDYGWSICTVEALDEALAKRSGELHDVKIRGGILLRRPAIADVENAREHFTWNSWHMTGIERKMAQEGLAYYIPVRYSEMPLYYRDNFVNIDVAMFQVAPMDAHGFFNFGPNSSHMYEMCRKAKKIIVEVNRNVPYCFGGCENGIHIDQVDMVVEGKHPPMKQMPAVTQFSDTDIAIASQVVGQIPNGACLQLGIGSMPGAIGKIISESDLKDLGVHTEMYVDAFVAMSKAGKITGNRKNFDRGRQTYTFAAGSQELYDFLDHNPQCMNAPVDYCNDIHRISCLDNFISINAALEIDLYGQVSAESSGTLHLTGSGGQQDFVMGAYLSKGGKSFICCPATVRDKKTGELKSRIRPTLAEGTIATCTRANTQYVVTEYGMVNLKGLSTWERAEALISIAAPQFREELIRSAEKQRIWRKGNR